MTAALLADRAAYTIEFCMAHRISRRTFYDLIERGELMHIGSKKTDQRRGGSKMAAAA